MEQSVYCAENHTAKQTTNQKNRPFDFQQNKQQTKRTVPLISRIVPIKLTCGYIDGYAPPANHLRRWRIVLWASEGET